MPTVCKPAAGRLRIAIFLCFSLIRNPCLPQAGEIRNYVINKLFFSRKAELYNTQNSLAFNKKLLPAFTAGSCN